MQAIKSSGTKIETIFAKALWANGLRYRKNCKNITGKPDFALKKHKIVIFCDSEFWHGKDWKKTVSRIGTNKKYWHTKIENNIKRDHKVNRVLKKEGWTVLRFWGNDISKKTGKCVAKVARVIYNNKKL